MWQSLLDVLHVLFRQPDFTIRLDTGGARLSQGHAPKGFIDDCAALARERGIVRGRVFGVKRSRGFVIEFSREVPERCHQHFRNVWQMYKGT